MDISNYFPAAKDTKPLKEMNNLQTAYTLALWNFLIPLSAEDGLMLNHALMERTAIVMLHNCSEKLT